MTPVVNVIRKDVYLLLLTQSFVAIGTSHTHRNVTNHPKYRQIIINCYLTILIVSLFYLGRLRIMTQLRSGAVDKMAGIFTKRIWQPCICQLNDLKIKNKSGGAKWGEEKIWGSMTHPGPPLEWSMIRTPEVSS